MVVDTDKIWEKEHRAKSQWAFSVLRVFMSCTIWTWFEDSNSITGTTKRHQGQAQHTVYNNLNNMSFIVQSLVVKYKATRNYQILVLKRVKYLKLPFKKLVD